jgi:hypothetical protein
VFLRGARTLAIKLNKIGDMPSVGICNRIEDTQIRFLIHPVTNGTQPHSLKPSFNALPYSSSSFIQMAGGGACGACGAAYLTSVAVLLPAPVGASGGRILI